MNQENDLKCFVPGYERTYFKIGQIWETRNGNTVKVVGINHNHRIYKIVVIEENNSDEISYTQQGLYYNGEEDRRDLVKLISDNEINFKTKIKMRVTPEQSKKVQEICFKNNISWSGNKELRHLNSPHLYINDEYLGYTDISQEEYFKVASYEEVDADLFIRTNGTCTEEFIYPMWFKNKEFDIIVRFDSINTCEVIQSKEAIYPVGSKHINVNHTLISAWEQVEKPNTNDDLSKPDLFIDGKKLRNVDMFIEKENIMQDTINQNSKIYKTIILDGIEYKLVPTGEIKSELLEDDLVEYKAKKEFKPFELKIQVNTIDELKSLWNRFVTSNNEIYKIRGTFYKVKEQESNNFFETWNYLDDILYEFGETPDIKRI